MSENQAFRKAIHLLAQPYSLAAILLLLLNDHLFRQVWPSWLTGKLGDFAWLFFFPLALAATLAWVVPARLPKQVRITGLLAFGFTGVIFAMTKTLPTLHSAVVQAASRAFGFPVDWRRDPSDLIALSALAAAWLLWQRTPTPSAHAIQPTKRTAWLLLSATALLTVANAAQPEAGIGCLRLSDEQIVACSSYSCSSSTDGGLTWVAKVELRPMDCQTWYYGQEPAVQTIGDATDPSIQYRSVPGEHIERSTDGGQSWVEDHPIRPIRQAERAYSFKSSNSNAVVYDVPLDALADPSSGNILFAMGFSGVLVRQPDGTYTSVAVGRFTPSQVSFGQRLLTVLSGEMILALIFGGLGIATIGLPQKRHWLRTTALVLGWLAWAATSIIFAPAIQEGAYAYMFPTAGTLVAGILALVLTAETLIRGGLQSGKLALWMGCLLLASAALCFLPFVLWLINLLPIYYLALGFGIVLGGGLLAIKRKMP